MRVLFGVIAAIGLSNCSTPVTTLPERASFDIEDPFFKGTVELAELTSTTGFKVLLKDDRNNVLDRAIFKYIPYQFDTADVDRDGRTEILVGLIKETEFDPGEKKRLFILRIDNGQLRPLWLGSRVCQELVDFKSVGGGIVRTLEKTTDQNFAIGDYYWQGFGLTLRNYQHNEISLNEAQRLLANTD